MAAGEREARRCQPIVERSSFARNSSEAAVARTGQAAIAGGQGFIEGIGQYLRIDLHN